MFRLQATQLILFHCQPWERNPVSVADYFSYISEERKCYFQTATIIGHIYLDILKSPKEGIRDMPERWKSYCDKLLYLPDWVIYTVTEIIYFFIYMNTF
jgi:hypothetical protein